MTIFISIAVVQRVMCILLVTAVWHTECRSRRRYRAVCSGSSRIDIQSEHGVKIEPIKYSRVYIDALSHRFEDGHSLTFEFKTHSANATLFYAVLHDDNYDMVSGGILNGYLQFKIRCRLSKVDLTIPKFPVDNGEWHTIKFQRRKRKAIFMLNDFEFFEQYYVGCGGFTAINFGSTHPDHHLSTSVSELKRTDGQLDGCIRNLRISKGIAAQPHYVAVSECN